MKDLFGYFDFALLDSLEFKEDSVREDLVGPSNLTALGYSSGGKNKKKEAKSSDIRLSRQVQRKFLC